MDHKGKHRLGSLFNEFIISKPYAPLNWNILCQVCRHKKLTFFRPQVSSMFGRTKNASRFADWSTMLDVKSLIGSTRVFSVEFFLHLTVNKLTTSQLPPYRKWWTSFCIMINPYHKKWCFFVATNPEKMVAKDFQSSFSNIERRLFWVEPKVLQQNDFPAAARSPKPLSVQCSFKSMRKSSNKLRILSCSPLIYGTSRFRKLLALKSHVWKTPRTVCGVTWIPQQPSLVWFGHGNLWFREMKGILSAIDVP